MPNRGESWSKDFPMMSKIFKYSGGMSFCWICLLLFVQFDSSQGSIYDGDEWSEWSDWSPCSRTCDGGVTQQFRRCKSSNGCHGVSIRRKMCNMQSCSEQRDYRADQCRAFDGISYKGQRRTWEAVEDPDSPCALTCRAEGTQIIAKLSPKLRDGTRCRTGTLHVCVDGRCVGVGCDLKLDSPKKIDVCGVCGGDSKSCSSPIYRWELLATSSCSAKCGGGQQQVKPICRNSLTAEEVDQMLCNSGAKPHRATQNCNIHPCEPEWETGEWSRCSTTCGGGLQIRKVFCAQEKNVTKIQVVDKLCQHIRKPTSQESCSPDPCPHWHAGPWSSCSVSCDKGYKTRNVVCRNAQNFPSSACDPRLKPTENKSCVENACGTTTLTPTAVLQTSRSPTKKRRVNKPPTVLPDVPTTQSTSPPTDDIFDLDNDNDFLLEEMPREHTLPLIQPYPPMDNAMLFDHNAVPSEPTKVRVYFACGWLFLSFVADQWGSCSSTCGEGLRRREVNCKIFLEFSRTIANLPDKECPGPKPLETEPCFSAPCSSPSMQSEYNGDGGDSILDGYQAALSDSDSTGSNQRKGLSVGLPPGISTQDMTYSWKVLGYSPCSASCLGGIQEAMIQCVRDYDQRMATPVLCMDIPKPDIATTRTCNDHPCPPRWNVSDFGLCSKPCGGGVMTREVSCIHEVTRGNTVIIPNGICPSPVPRTEMLCNTVNCPPYWEPGDWSRCSRSCGGGLRTRTLHCKQVSALGQVVELLNGDHHCTQPKPAESKSCNKKACQSNKQGVKAGPPVFSERVTLTVKGREMVYAGVALKLRCPSPKGVDKATLMWVKGHEYLNVNPQRMEVIHKTGVLKIKNTTYSDSGIYTCLYNGRSVSNITLMIQPYQGDSRLDKRPRGRNALHDSTLYADQQSGGVSVPMSDGQVVGPNSESPLWGDSSVASSSAAPSSFQFPLHSLLLYVLSWMDWPWSFPRKEGKKSSSRLERLQDNSWSYHEGLLLPEFRRRHRHDTLKTTGRRKISNSSNADKCLEHSEGSCPKTTPRWIISTWSECRATDCFNWNTSLKRRKVSCNFPNGTLSNEANCFKVTDERPFMTEECYNPLCLGMWTPGPWSYCKAKCGTVGFQTRIISCVWYGNKQPAGHACHNQHRPQVIKSCRGTPCIFSPLTSFSESEEHLNANVRQKIDHVKQILQKTPPTSTSYMSYYSNYNNPYHHQRNFSSSTRSNSSSKVLPDYWDLYDEGLTNDI